MEPIGKFTLYIIPEACATGNGSNVVLSLLQHYIDNFSLGGTDCVRHADNCTGQNKNNYVMQYALWRTLCGLTDQLLLTSSLWRTQSFGQTFTLGCSRKSSE